MTISTVSWYSDTCSCVAKYEYDDTTPLDTRTYTVIDFQACSNHIILPDTTARHNAAQRENTWKNIALGLILERAPANWEGTLFVTKTNELGETYRILKPAIKGVQAGVTFNFNITGTAPNRIINISFIGITLTTTQRNTAQAWLDNRFGAGKVILG